MQINDIQNPISHKKMIGIVNQPASPFRKGDALEILKKFYDPTVVGDHVYVARVITSTNPQLLAQELNGIRLVACDKVDAFNNY